MMDHRVLATPLLLLLACASPALARATDDPPPVPAAPGSGGLELAGSLGVGPHGVLFGLEAGYRRALLRGGLVADIQGPIGEPAPLKSGDPPQLLWSGVDLALSTGLVHQREVSGVPVGFSQSLAWRADLSLEAGRSFVQVFEWVPADQPDGRTFWMGFWFAGLRGSVMITSRGGIGIGLGGFLRRTVGPEAGVETVAGEARGGRLLGGLYLIALLDLGRS